MSAAWYHNNQVGAKPLAFRIWLKQNSFMGCFSQSPLISQVNCFHLSSNCFHLSFTTFTLVSSRRASKVTQHLNDRTHNRHQPHTLYSHNHGKLWPHLSARRSLADQVLHSIGPKTHYGIAREQGEREASLIWIWDL